MITITRWDKWFSEGNLTNDKRILSAQHTRSAENAARTFISRHKHLILDLACGVCRDTYYFNSCGLDVVSVDASFNALQVVQRMKTKRGVVTKPVTADARHLPFMENSFEGVYCFGLLHEFTSDRKDRDVQDVMREVRRLLSHHGLLILTVLSGEPEEGLPKVQMYTQQMLELAARDFQQIIIEQYDDIGCTGRTDYHVWYGLFQK